MSRLALPLLLFLASLPAFAGWKEPVAILSFPRAEIRKEIADKPLGVGNFQLECVDKNGYLFFRNMLRKPSCVTILDTKGQLVRHIPAPPIFEEKYQGAGGCPQAIRVLGDTERLLIHSSRFYPQWLVYDYEGRLLQIITSNAGLFTQYIYPDGRFLIWYGDKYAKDAILGAGTWSPAKIFWLYDKDGTLLEILNAPPKEVGFAERVWYDGDGSRELRFPDVRYILRDPVSREHDISGTIVRDRRGGFSTRALTVTRGKTCSTIGAASMPRVALWADSSNASIGA